MAWRSSRQFNPKRRATPKRDHARGPGKPPGPVHSKVQTSLRSLVDARERARGVVALHAGHHDQTAIAVLEREHLAHVTAVPAGPLDLEAVVVDPASSRVTIVFVRTGAIALVIERDLRDDLSARILDAHDLRAALDAEDVGKDAGKLGKQGEHAVEDAAEHGPRRPLAEYDPSVRTDAELARDIDRQPRHGESAHEAEKRSNAAREEQVRRGKMAACFVSGTLVQTPDGIAPIDSLVAGSLVLAKADDGTGALTTFRVGESLTGKTRVLYRISLSLVASVEATGNHPFFVVGRGWRRARELVAGDRLETLDGSGAEIVAVERVQLTAFVTTHNIHVPTASTYYVCGGSGPAVWVHNTDPNDPKLATSLLWGLGGKGPRQRVITDEKPDFDGASAWATDSKAEVERMMGTRVKETAGKAANANHGAVTREQLAAKGLVAVETPGHGALATEAGLKHYSIRPVANPDPKVPLTPKEMDFVKEQLESIEPHIKVKPKELGCG